MSGSVVVPCGGRKTAVDVGNRPHRIVVALNFGTRAGIDLIRRTWCRAGGNVPLVAAGDYDDEMRGIVYVPPSNVSLHPLKTKAQWLRRPNHEGDPRSLVVARITNSSFEKDWDFIFIGDMDTRPNLPLLIDAVAHVDASEMLLLGYMEATRGGECYGATGCCAAGTPPPCLVPQELAAHDYYGTGLHRPPIWAFGGAGYLLSRGLMNQISEEGWIDCENRMHFNGGDVRVAACIFSHTGVGLTILPGLMGSLSQHPWAEARALLPERNRTTAVGFNLLGACLAGHAAPPKECTAHWDQPGCMRAQVPAWAVTTARVGECFRCCIAREASRRHTALGFWPRVLSSTFMSKHGSLSKMPSVLMGPNSDLRWAQLGSLYKSTRIIGPEKLHESDSILTVVLQGYTRESPVALQSLLAHSPRGRPMRLITLGDQTLFSTDEALAQLYSAVAGDSRIVEWFTNSPPAPGLMASLRHTSVNPPRWRVRVWPRGLYAPQRWRKGDIRQTNRMRQRLLFCGCLSVESHWQRPAKLAALVANGFDCAPDCVKYSDLMFESTFVFSPRGAGGQNHRDWEALIAGAIPLVDYNEAFDQLWDGLPVLQVKDWSLITPEYLRAEWKRMHGRSYSLQKAYAPYWIHAYGNLRSIAVDEPDAADHKEMHPSMIFGDAAVAFARKHTTRYGQRRTTRDSRVANASTLGRASKSANQKVGGGRARGGR